MSATTDLAASQKRRSFLMLVVALIAAVAVVGIGLGGRQTPGAGGSAAGAVTLQTACAEIAPDMAFRVDALRRTAGLVRADVVTMQRVGNTADAARATKVADALEAAAVAEDSQRGVRRATRELGLTLASIC
jgi:hypothetical protein